MDDESKGIRLIISGLVSFYSVYNDLINFIPLNHCKIFVLLSRRRKPVVNEILGLEDWIADRKESSSSDYFPLLINRLVMQVLKELIEEP